MADDTELNDIILNLINRGFETSAIKQYLLNKGFNKEEIEIAITEGLKNSKGTSKNAVTTYKGWRGLLLIIFGLLILLYLLMFGRDSNYPAINFLRLILGFGFLIRGIYITTRPLKSDK